MLFQLNSDDDHSVLSFVMRVKRGKKSVIQEQLLLDDSLKYKDDKYLVTKPFPWTNSKECWLEN